MVVFSKVWAVSRGDVRDEDFDVCNGCEVCGM
jgi:hypothetical protein